MKIAVVIALLVSRLALAEHLSTGIIQILPGNPEHQTENFIANEIASLSMGVVLKEAASKNQWEQDGLTLDTVKKNLGITRIEGTDMVEITAQSNDPKQAKQIVNAIIQAYVSIRMNQEVNAREKKLEALDNELIAQSDLVQDNRKELTVIIQQYRIPYFEKSPDSLGQIEIELFNNSRKKLHDLKIELALHKGKFQILEEDKTEREKLEPQIAILAAQIEKIAGIANDRQDDSIGLSLKQNNYNQSLNTYRQSLDLLNDMKRQQQEDRVALKMPRDVIIIRQKPE